MAIQSAAAGQMWPKLKLQVRKRIGPLIVSLRNQDMHDVGKRFPN